MDAMREKKRLVEQHNAEKKNLQKVSRAKNRDTKSSTSAGDGTQNNDKDDDDSDSEVTWGFR